MTKAVTYCDLLDVYNELTILKDSKLGLARDFSGLAVEFLGPCSGDDRKVSIVYYENREQIAEIKLMHEDIKNSAHLDFYRRLVRLNQTKNAENTASIQARFDFNDSPSSHSPCKSPKESPKETLRKVFSPRPIGLG